MKTLTCLVTLVCLPVAVGWAQSPSSQTPTDTEPVMYTLTVDEEMIRALREGQSLMSTIPPSIRGKVDRIRIEFKASNSPSSASPPAGNSILDRSQGTGAPPSNPNAASGSSQGFLGQPPPLLPPNLNTGGQRSNSPSGLDLSSQPTSNSWSLGSAAARSGSTLTPIDPPQNSWLLGNRNDSNAIGRSPTGLSGVPSSSPSSFPLPNRTTGVDFARSEELNTGPPAFSRSLPTLESQPGSSGIFTSPPSNLPMAADKMPSFGSDQIVSKPPAESASRQLLAAGDTAAIRQENRTQVYLFMMLLCSLGLNVYLGWISRGFYIRYAELASELRDSFTSSSAA